MCCNRWAIYRKTQWLDRIRLSVKHKGEIEFEVRQQTRELGTKPRYSTPSISPTEASKLGEAIRTASARLESVG